MLVAVACTVAPQQEFSACRIRETWEYSADKSTVTWGYKMKAKEWRLVSAIALGGLASLGQASDVNTTTVPGMVSDGGGWPIVASYEGRKVALTTSQSLVAEDSDGSLDGYILDLDSGEIELLVPQPAIGSVTPTTGNSFSPGNFSADGNRLLLIGNSNVASAAFSSAAVVFDFATREYIQASVLPDNVTQADYANDAYMSRDGKYVVFSNANSIGPSEWEKRWYRRNLEEGGSTQIAFTKHDGTAAIKEDDATIYAISSDGGQLLGYARDGILDADDTNGSIDYFVIDVGTNTATRVDAVTYEGNVLPTPTAITASPDFSYLLLEFGDAEVPSRIGTWTVHDYYGVYNVATGETLGLTEFLGLPERYMQIWDDTSRGSETAYWGDSSRYLIVLQGVLQLPGDADFDSQVYVIDRDTDSGWIAGMDDTGTVHTAGVPYGRANGGVLQYMAGAAGDDVGILEYTPLLRDLAVSAAASPGEVVITLHNDGDEDIYNAGVSIAYSRNQISALNGTDSFDGCANFEINGEKRAECRVDLIPAGTSKDFTLTVDSNVTLDILAGLLADRDETPNNNSVSVDVPKPSETDNGGTGDDDSGGGGGPLGPWLIAALLSIGLLQRRRSC